mmetsp:Transcript_40226/g.66786  ORF Transcript_40226/g.66786 Transcript_40226/m.66786 type:complete len:208 (+) Transcript_40226:632-1255(+)
MKSDSVRTAKAKSAPAAFALLNSAKVKSVILSDALSRLASMKLVIVNTEVSRIVPAIRARMNSVSWTFAPEKRVVESNILSAKSHVFMATRSRLVPLKLALMKTAMSICALARFAWSNDVRNESSRTVNFTFCMLALTKLVSVKGSGKPRGPPSKVANRKSAESKRAAVSVASTKLVDPALAALKSAPLAFIVPKCAPSSCAHRRFA